MNNSNQTLRFSRTSKEAIGYPLKSWHFQPPTPDQGDKAVAITCIAIAILLPLASWIFNMKLGG